MAQTIQTHIVETKQNIYSSRKVKFPEPVMSLFNREQILEAYVEEEKRIAAKEAAQNTGRATAINLHNMGMDVTFIAKAINQSVDVVKAWLGIIH